MADVQKEIALKVTTDTSQTTSAFKSTKQELRETQKAMVDLALAGKQGSEEFKRLEQRAGVIKDTIGDMGQRVNNLANDTPKLELLTQAATGIAGGFAVAQGAAALFGDENEDVQKAIMKTQAAMSILNGVQSIANVLNKDAALGDMVAAKAKGVFTAAVKISTGALKSLRGALIATGVGAVVVAVGMLVANFDKVTEAVTKFVSGSPALTKVLKFIGDTFTNIGESLGFVEDKTTKNLRTQIEAAEKQKRLLEAQGKDTAKVEGEILTMKLAVAKRTKEGVNEAQEAITLFNAEQIAKREEAEKKAAEKKGELDKAAAAKAKEAANAEAQIQVELNQTLEDLQAQNIANEEARALKQLELERSRARQQLVDKKASDALLIEFDKQTETQRKAITDQAQADRDAKAKEDNDKILENAKAVSDKILENAKAVSDALQQARIDSIENEFARAQAELEIKRQAKEAELLLAGASNEEILAVNKSFYEQSVKIAKEAEDKILADKIANFQKGLELAANGYQSLIDLQIAFGGESEKDQKRVFEINKKYNIAKAIIETIGAAQTAYASQLVVGDPTSVVRGAIAATLAIAQGLARVKMIKKTKFESPEDPANTGGGGSIPTGGGGGQQQPPAAFNPNVTPTNPTGQPNPMGQGQQPLRAYVVDRDIENASSRRNMLRDFAAI
jgi:hypothetical protein